jgi:hypothetical protein
MVRKRKIIVYIATSADGFLARSDGSVDWLDRPRPKGNYGMGAFYQSIDTVLWGRKTCDMALLTSGRDRLLQIILLKIFDMLQRVGYLRVC